MCPLKGQYCTPLVQNMAVMCHQRIVGDCPGGVGAESGGWSDTKCDMATSVRRDWMQEKIKI